MVAAEATVQTLHMRSWHQVQAVLVEVCADQVSASLGEARVVELLEEWRGSGRNDRIEYNLRTAGGAS